MNLLSLIQNQLSPQAVGQISNAVGESPEATKSALGTAFPALLGSLVGKANESPSGPGEILNMIKQGQNQGGWTDSISNLISGFGAGSAPATQHSLLSSLLGSKLGPVADFIASRCGIRGTSATSLMGMAAPLLMGLVGKHVSSQGLGPSGLGQFLSSQVPYLKNALPSGLANTLGIGNLLTETPKVETQTYDTSRTAYARAAEPVHESAPSFLKWAWVPLLAALAIWFFVNRANRASEMGAAIDAPRTETRTVTSPKPIGFSALNLAPGGIGDTIAKAISAGDWGKTIELQGLTKDSTASWTDAAKSKVQEIGSVLSSSPGTKVQITGFGETEEVGLERATSIKNAIIATGVAAERISARGATGTGMPTLSLMR